jgi:ribosomal protein S18 acetylase RimI-like enzyme
MRIRTMRPEDTAGVTAIWNACTAAGEVLYYPTDGDGFRRKFTEGPGREPENLLAAEEDGRICGFLHGVAPGTFPGAKAGCAYLTTIMVAAPCRGKGTGRALLETFKERMAERGAETLYISSLNPVNLEWRIPGTPGHDHNNMPGADTGCAGYGFLEKSGFTERYREVAMYMALEGWRLPPAIEGIRERLRSEGIETGPYDPERNCGFDRMCDAVGSDYWRDVLRTEIAAWKSGKPNADPRMWADGIPPRGPRTLLTAVRGDQIIGFTGPVDLQKSGRGWFTGICTDPSCERKGIATVLFNLLMDAFVREGAAFSTLFTGLENHARKVYERAGMRPVREFSLMAMPLEGGK